MTGYEVLQSSAAYPLVFLLVLSSDHISPATGLSPTVVISKNGGAFGSPSGAVTEIANGWYKVAGNATDTATLGPIILHASVATADPTDEIFPVVAVNPQSTTYGLVLAKTTNLTGLNDIAATAIVSSGAITTSGGAVSTVTTVTNQLTAAAIATGVFQDTTASDFTVASSIGKSLYTNTPQTGDSFARIGALGASLTALAPSGTALSTAQWTNTRAGLLDLIGTQQINYATALAGFPFYLALSSDHYSPATGKTVTATRSLNGGAFGACANAVNEIANGWYQINLSAGDLTGTTVALSFSAAASDTTLITIVTQP